MFVILSYFYKKVAIFKTGLLFSFEMASNNSSFIKISHNPTTKKDIILEDNKIINDQTEGSETPVG